ncbi:MAG: DNA translocase FtsK [Candidatus Dormibacteria bacterium]
MATTRSKARPNPAARRGLSPEQRGDLVGLLLLGLSGLSAVALALPGQGRLTASLRDAESWALGWGAVLLPLLLGALGIQLLRRRRPAATSLIGLAAVVLGCLGLMHFIFVPEGRWAFYSGTGGGLVGYLLAASLNATVGLWGALGLLLVLFLAGMVLATEVSLVGVARRARGAATGAWQERRRLARLVQGAGEPRLGRAAAQVAGAAGGRSALPLLPVADDDDLVRPLRGARPEPVPHGDPAEELPPFEPRLLATPEGPAAGAPVPEPEAAGAPPALPALPHDAFAGPPRAWSLPPLAMLDTVTNRRERLHEEVRRNVQVIERTLSEFSVDARVVGVNPGPAVTQYELQPGVGVAVKKITSLGNDLALALAAAPIRIEAPIPGKSAVGVEVPNRSTALVSLKEVLAADVAGGDLRVALGKDVSGQPVSGDLARMPHLLIAGAPGSGKSVCINAFVASLLMQYTPDMCRLLLIDPKRVELTPFNDIPHLMAPVVVEPEHAVGVLRWCISEMDRRYKLFASRGVRNIQAHNARAQVEGDRRMPFIVVIIDELADLMMVAAGEIEEVICRIAQLARAVGIHLVVATQRPSADIVTGLIKANVPSRIAFAVSSGIDSRVVLDSGGAEKLLGRGDMLYQPVDAGKPVRLQGAFVSDRELEQLVSFWREQGGPQFVTEVLNARAQASLSVTDVDDRRLDPLFSRAARTVAAEGVASVSLIQRKFNVGYSRAGRLVDQLAEHRVVGGYVGSKSREVLMGLVEVDDLLNGLGESGALGQEA